jgi:hypothetical protein
MPSKYARREVGKHFIELHVIEFFPVVDRDYSRPALFRWVQDLGPNQAPADLTIRF